MLSGCLEIMEFVCRKACITTALRHLCWKALTVRLPLYLLVSGSRAYLYKVHKLLIELNIQMGH
jgi:hypothetical protein